MNNISDIVILLRKKIDGTISNQEFLLLTKWVEKDPLHAELLKKAEDEEMVLDDIRSWLELREGEEKDAWGQQLESRTLDKIRAADVQQKAYGTSVFWRYLSYAAVIFIISTFVFISYRSYMSSGQHAETHDLTPGTNKALITLSDGNVIELREDQEGVVLGEQLTYEDGTFITQLNDEKAVYATIETPRGGQYQIILADGTKVWLNADTKLTYPSRFTGESRVVELTGEAYFEVSPSAIRGKKVPFRIKTGHQEVEVLGTHFNIKAYPDEGSDIRTTLVEGSVQLHAWGKTLLLQPGEQGVSNEQGLNKKKVEIDQYIAWKNNEFVFDETELKDALKMLSRWYDFDVSIEDSFPTTHLYGSISRNQNLTEVLKIMESSGIKFKIERAGNRNVLICFTNNQN